MALPEGRQAEVDGKRSPHSAGTSGPHSIAGSGRRPVLRFLVFAFFCALLGLILLPGIAEAGRGTWEKRRVKKGQTDRHEPRMSRYSFVNDRVEFGGLTLVANSWLALQRLDREYLTVGFVLVNEGKGCLSLDPARFTLVLADGTRIPEAGEEVLTGSYRGMVGHDFYERRMADVTSGYYAFANRYIRTEFYPPPGHQRFPLHVDVCGDNYAADWVYFRNPENLAGQVVTLVFVDPEGNTPVKKIEVRFPLDPEEKRGKKAGKALEVPPAKDSNGSGEKP